MSDKKKPSGSAYKKQTSKGEVINLVIDGKRYNMWPNSYKTDANQPDFKIFEDNYVKNTEQTVNESIKPVGGSDLPF